MRDQLTKHGTLLEVLPQTGMCGREPIERQHFLDGICVAEQHHDFLQIWATHGATPLQVDRHSPDPETPNACGRGEVPGRYRAISQEERHAGVPRSARGKSFGVKRLARRARRGPMPPRAAVVE
jgi:hypothetical protein